MPSNTQSDFTISVTYTNSVAGDKISNDVIAELERRTVATVAASASSVGDAIVSQTPPDDKTKIWYIADANGVPTGEAFAWNSATGQWESTSLEVAEPLCVSTDSDNLITEDSKGCLKVSKNEVESIASEAAKDVIPEISTDSGNQIVTGTDLGWYVGEPTPSTDASNYITTGSDGKLYAPDPALGIVDHGELFGEDLIVTCTLQNEWYRVPLDDDGHFSGMVTDTVNHDIEVGKTGAHYSIANTSFGTGGADTIELTIATDGLPVAHTTTQRKLGTGGDVGAASCGGIETYTDGEKISLYVRCISAAAKVVTFEYVNLSAIRLG